MYAGVSRVVVAVALVVLVLVLPAPAPGDGCARPTRAQLARLPAEWPRFRLALHRSFGRRWLEAAVVSYGESRWQPAAANGQYLGYFQMGAVERARTGWTSDAAGQVRAASLLNRLSGDDWSPWSCRP